MRADRDAETVSGLKQLRQQRPCYGVRSLRDALEPALRPSYGKCYRLSNENGLLTRKKRPHSLTKCDQRALQSDDLVQRDFTASAPCVKCFSDITQINCADGKLYLAALMDCFDGAIVGFSMNTLCCAAVRDAVARYGYKGKLILHSDHGAQYTSHEYRKLLDEYGFQQSMGRTHCCFDNARMESFFATLKKS